MSKAGQIFKRLTPYNIKKGIRYLKHYGVRGFYARLLERFEEREVEYQEWYEKNKPSEEGLARQRKKKWKEPVTISVLVPAYRTPEVFLRQMIESVLNQTYPHLELCIADGSGENISVEKVVKEYQAKDQRVRYQRLEKNEGIAGNTNAAIRMATGDYLALFDHDDLLAPNALFEVASTIEKDKADVVYTDEDKVTSDLKEHFQPHFKPDFNPDLLCSNNYICHLFVVKRSLALKLGGQDPAYDGAQDYDFIFRCTEEADGQSSLRKQIQGDGDPLFEADRPFPSVQGGQGHRGRLQYSQCLCAGNHQERTGYSHHRRGGARSPGGL